VGVFSQDLMACAAIVHVGPARQAFWALYTRSDARLRERTRMFRRSAVTLAPGRLHVHDGDVELALELHEGPGIEARCPHPGGGEVWTRKQAGVLARGTLRLAGGPPREVHALAVIDDTAGYHARHTEWRWSAGVGTSGAGAPVAWNLVEGVNDPPAGSERAVWLDGAPHEPSPVRFAADLSEIVAADGSTLRFAPEAQRSRRENMLIVRSEYRAPFGRFSGSLPDGVELAQGLGVMEHHTARW
jgi:Protein of unknown function (DUF2804)